MRTLFYLIGAPGTGKTTLMAALTDECIAFPLGVPFGSLLVSASGRELAELGVRRARFGGTDGLSMNIQPTVLRWLVNPGYELVIGEGDRLGGVTFLDGALGLGWRIRLAVLTAARDVLAARYALRGSNQSAGWVEGRFTKVQNVSAWATREQIAGRPIDVLYLNGEAPTSDSAHILMSRWPELREAFRL